MYAFCFMCGSVGFVCLCVCVCVCMCVCVKFPGSLQVLTVTSTYRLNLPSKALQVLIFASQSLQKIQV